MEEKSIKIPAKRGVYTTPIPTYEGNKFYLKGMSIEDNEIILTFKTDGSVMKGVPLGVYSEREVQEIPIGTSRKYLGCITLSESPESPTHAYMYFVAVRIFQGTL